MNLDRAVATSPRAWGNGEPESLVPKGGLSVPQLAGEADRGAVRVESRWPRVVAASGQVEPPAGSGFSHYVPNHRTGSITYESTRLWLCSLSAI